MKHPNTDITRTFRAYALKPLSIVAALALLAMALPHQAGAANTPRVLPLNSSAYGKTYAEWSAEWNKWVLALPVENHPFTDSPNIDFSAGQSGQVWFLAATFGTTERSLTLPQGTALFVALLNTECSSLETEESGFHGDTEAEQAACAKFYSDHIIDLFLEIDGVPVKDIQNYRFVSPQYTFTAPTPWIFGDVGGTGTSVSDGYYVMLSPLSKGQHTLHYGGSFHFSIAEGDEFDADFGIDTTYHITVE